MPCGIRQKPHPDRFPCVLALGVQCADLNDSDTDNWHIEAYLSTFASEYYLTGIARLDAAIHCRICSSDICLEDGSNPETLEADRYDLVHLRQVQSSSLHNL